MSTKITKRAIPHPTEAPNRKSVESLQVAVNELTGAVGENMQRAVRVCELVDAGILALQPNGQLGRNESIDQLGAIDMSDVTGLTAALNARVLKAGDTMTGPIQQANGNTFLQTVAGAKVLSGPSGNTTVIQAAIPGAAGLVARNSAGADVFGAGGAAVTSYLPHDMRAGGRVFNAGQLKVYDSNNDTPVELGLGYTNGTDRNAYLQNRNNGWLSFGTNNLERVRILAAGQTLFRLDMRHYVGSVSTQSVMRYLGWNNEVPRWAEVVEADATYSLYNYSTSGASADRIFNLIGANMGTKRIISYGEVAQQAGNNAFRTVVGNYGSFWHMNSTHVHLMMTNSGDQYGSFNSLRPMYVNITTGKVDFGHVVSVAGDTYVAGRFYPAGHVAAQGTALVLSAVNNPASFIYVRPNGADNTVGQTQWNAAGEMFTQHAIHSRGASAALFFQNRSGSQDWAWYCNGNVTYLWNGSTNIMSTDSSGNFSANNWTATSDARLKRDIHPVPMYDQLDHLRLSEWVWKSDGKTSRGLIAQEVQRFAPAYVLAHPETGMLSIDKGGLAVELALAALSQIKELRHASAS